MNRRQFNVTAAASLWLPTLFIPRQRVKHIDLSLFCDDDYYPLRRYDLTTPFHQEDLTYATDSRVCVRTGLPVVMGDSPEEKRLPKAMDLPWDHDQRTGWRSWDRISFVPVPDKKSHVCPRCFRKGRVGECQPHQTCGGSGYVTIGDEYEKDCDCKTGWIGGSACPRCEGSGYVLIEVDMGGGVHVAPALHAKVATLGNVEYCLVDDPQQPVRFRADCVDGLLMPLAKC